MAAKASSERAGAPPRQARRTLPAIRASVRRSEVRTPRKARRAKHAPGLGGRLAAAIRTARLRAIRAAEEFGMRR
jgi:hypothetical protein